MTIICFCFASSCFAESNNVSAGVVCDNDCVKVGKSLKIKAFIESEYSLNLTSFRFTIKYDSSKFVYNKFTAPRRTNKRNFNVNVEDNLIRVEYMQKRSGILLDKSLDVCNFIFDSISSVDTCESKFEFVDFEVTDSSRNTFPVTNLRSLTVNIEGEVKPNCYLSRLVPSSGKLVPDFSKDVFEYDIYVSYGTSFMDFDICCENELAVSNVSRRKLAAVGKDTKIQITVNDKKAKSKNIYIVNVHRNNKPSPQERVTANTETNTDSPSKSVRQGNTKNKSKSSTNKSKSRKITSKNENNKNDDSENSNDTNISPDSDYVALDENSTDENPKNSIDEKIIVGIVVVVILGGLCVYKIVSKNRQDSI